MKKITTVFSILIVIAVAFVVALPLLLSSDLVRNRILSHLTDLTGRSVSFNGDPTLTFSPFLGLELSDLVISGSTSDENNSPMLVVETLKAKLDILPAIWGDIKITDYEFLRPRLMLKTDEQGVSNWQFDIGAIKDALDSVQISSEDNQQPLATAYLGNFHIIDGSLEFANSKSGRTEKATNINGSISWPNTNEALNVEGNAIWRNESVNVSLNLNSPLRFLAGGESDTLMDFQTEPLNFSFKGKANLFADLFVQGEIEANSPSISRLSGFLNLDIDDTDIIGNWTAQGTLDATQEISLLKDATISIGDNTAQGVVRLASISGKNLKLDGTLAFGEIDLTNYLLQKLTTSSQFLPKPEVLNLDMDFRLSANAVTLGEMVLNNVASAISLDQGKWKLDIGDAHTFGGQIVASVEADNTDKDNSLVVKLSANDIDLDSLPPYIKGSKLGLSGKTDFEADLRASLPIASLSESKISGSTSIEIHNGKLSGLNIQNLLDQTIPPGSVYIPDEDDTDMNYDTLKLNGFLTDSKMTISQSRINTQSMEILVLGSINLISSKLHLTAQALKENTPQSLRLTIGGTWLAPNVVATNPDKEIQPETDTLPDQ